MNAFVRYLSDIRDEVVSRHDEEVFSDGYNAAANLCVDVVALRLDELLAEMKTGALKGDRQIVFSELSELKTEIERRLRAYPDDQTDTPF